jgi:shikimate kinase
MQKGETVFREIEHDCLARVLGSASARNTRLILALGGGTFTQQRNVTLIREFADNARGAGSVVIWLDCSAEDLLKRCVLMGDRPLFRDEASFRKLYEERMPYYRQADYRVESSGEPMRVVEQILALGIFGRSTQIRAGGNLPGAPHA